MLPYTKKDQFSVTQSKEYSLLILHSKYLKTRHQQCIRTGKKRGMVHSYLVHECMTAFKHKVYKKNLKDVL